jgi:hypothetical protein
MDGVLIEHGIGAGLPIKSTNPITVTPNTANQVLSKGQYLKDITILGDPDLIAANIKKGVNTFGVVGSLLAAPNLNTPVGQTTSTSVNALQQGIIGVKTLTFATITQAFSYMEASGLNIQLNAVGTTDGNNQHNVWGFFKIKFRATGYVITIAYEYYSGLSGGTNKQGTVGGFTMIVSPGIAKVTLSSVTSSDSNIPTSSQTFSNVGIDTSSGIDLILEGQSDNTASAFYGQGYSGAGGTSNNVKGY